MRGPRPTQSKTRVADSARAATRLAHAWSTPVADSTWAVSGEAPARAATAAAAPARPRSPASEQAKLSAGSTS
eukprot:5802046-Pyramimonas_sp.AAC.1